MPLRLPRGLAFGASASLPTAALALLAIGLPLLASAQVPLTPRDLGMAGSSLAIARGQEALFLNPANLALARNPRWSLALPAGTVQASTRGPGAMDFVRYLTGDGEAEGLNNLMAEVPASGMELDVELRSPIVALQIGPLAAGVSYRGAVHQTFGRDMVDLVLGGFEEGRTDYRVGDTFGRRVDYLDVVVGYGQKLGPVAVGINAHYLKGRSVAKSRLYDPRIGPGGSWIEVDYAEVWSPGGSGVGFDLGVAYQPTPRMTFSGLLANAVGRMNWDGSLRTRELTLRDEDFENDPVNVLDRFTESERRLAGTGGNLRLQELAHGITDDMSLARTLRLGGAYDLPTSTQIAAALQTRVGDGNLAGGWDKAVSLGLQQKLIFLTLRGGFATDMGDRRMLSGALSLGPLEFAVAQVQGEVDGHKHSGILFSVGSGIRGPMVR